MVIRLKVNLLKTSGNYKSKVEKEQVKEMVDDVGLFRLSAKKMKTKAIILMLAFVVMFVSASNAQTTTVSAADSAAIKQTALDYIEGWYYADAERMERALHPDLAKRIVRTNPQGKSRFDQMSAMTLVQYTRAGGGKSVPRDKQQKDVTILDVFENAASVKVVASDWVDYMQMAKFDGRWVIVNVLWELKPIKK